MAKRLIYISSFLLLLSSCKTTEKCEAYTENYDIHMDHIESQKKYCSTTELK